MRYEAPKGGRIKSFKFVMVSVKGYWDVKFIDGTRKWESNDSLYGEDGKLIKYDSPVDHFSSNYAPVRSLRTFRRRLRQWGKELPKGTKVTLVSRYIGHNVHAVIK